MARLYVTFFIANWNYKTKTLVIAITGKSIFNTQQWKFRSQQLPLEISTLEVKPTFRFEYVLSIRMWAAVRVLGVHLPFHIHLGSFIRQGAFAFSSFRQLSAKWVELR